MHVEGGYAELRRTVVEDCSAVNSDVALGEHGCFVAGFNGTASCPHAEGGAISARDGSVLIVDSVLRGCSASTSGSGNALGGAVVSISSGVSIINTTIANAHAIATRSREVLAICTPFDFHS